MLAHAHNLEGAKVKVLRDDLIISFSTSSSDWDMDH